MFRVETLAFTYCELCHTFLNNTLGIFVFCNIQANFTIGFDGSVTNLNRTPKTMLKYKPDG
jgi:spore coat protein U-like protein